MICCLNEFTSFNSSKQSGQVWPHLHRVESAVAVEGEADDVGGVLVPAGVDGVTHDVSGFGEDLLDQNLLSTQRDPLAKIRSDANHKTLTGWSPLGLSLHLPSLQLPNHWSQLVEPSLLVQLREVLTEEDREEREKQIKP